MYKIYDCSGDWLAEGNTLEEAVEQYNALYDEDLTVEELLEDSTEVPVSPDQYVYWTARHIGV